MSLLSKVLFLGKAKVKIDEKMATSNFQFERETNPVEGFPHIRAYRLIIVETSL